VQVFGTKAKYEESDRGGLIDCLVLCTRLFGVVRSIAIRYNRSLRSLCAKKEAINIVKNGVAIVKNTLSRLPFNTLCCKAAGGVLSAGKQQ